MPRILPLSDDAVAQIRSSRQITSLNGVALGLLENSLDAGATKVDVTIHFRQGACIVEDDGHGILSEDFAAGGGLLQMYHTSATDSVERHGLQGTFLASLAALSLLSITSRHEHGQLCSHLSAYQGRILKRNIPALSAQELELSSSHTTKVSVRDLFGNMAVRVKQRATIADSTAELDKLWQELVDGIVALLLAWPRPCSVKLRDAADGRGAVIIPGWYPDTKKPLTRKALRQLLCKSAKTDLRDALPVLFQAGLASPDTRSDWVPVSASTSRIRLQGLICLQPAPSKRCQFISIGVSPLHASRETAGPYELVNKLFALSDFGELQPDIRTKDGLSRNGSDRVKSADAGKGIDRWPMFVLRLELKDDKKLLHVQDALDQARLESISSIIDASVKQWLRIHHFRPRNEGRQRRAQSASPLKTAVMQRPRTLTGTQQMTEVAEQDSRTEETGIHALSRVRAGQRSLRRASTLPMSTAHKEMNDDNHDTPIPPLYSLIQHVPVEFSGYNEYSESSNYFREVRDADLLNLHTPASVEDLSDNKNECTVWTDPASRMTYRVDTRTGNIIRTATSAEASTRENEAQEETRGTQQDLRQSANLCLRDLPDRGNAKASWLPGFLKDWHNPVFKPQEEEEAIPVATYGGPDLPVQEELQHRCGSRGNHEHISNGISKYLRKDDLEKVLVISQVDGKFILCKIPGDKDTLLLVDQHAASERVILERLLAELCTPATAEETSIWTGVTSLTVSKYTVLEKPLHFQLVVNEMEMFKRHSPHFARWGILYDTVTNASNLHDTLVVKALPVGVAERCRLSPSLLIDLLREEIWHPVSIKVTSEEQDKDTNSKHFWLKRMGSCPKGIIDMLNSRACRSAIMFNDVLSHTECQQLMNDLAGCAFPFMCAHGRVSMVPLLELVSDGRTDIGSHSMLGKTD